MSNGVKNSLQGEVIFYTLDNALLDLLPPLEGVGMPALWFVVFAHSQTLFAIGIETLVSCPSVNTFAR
jgi:hypothetical protein